MVDLQELQSQQNELFKADPHEQERLYGQFCATVIDADLAGVFSESDSVDLISDQDEEEVYAAAHAQAASLIVYAALVIGDPEWMEAYRPLLDEAEKLENPYLREGREEIWTALNNALINISSSHGNN